ncbi:MAG: Ribulose-phosphate 3-epimerase [bacterium ADurb.Bin429]|nr:MAG: Ribulose-phosphate 3-epimerase [bacterium ADurb.Bin429]
MSAPETLPYPIHPSILAFDFSIISEQMRALDVAGADAFHFDVMDDHFVPNLTFGPMVLRTLRSVTARAFHAHLMAYHPDAYIPRMAEAGVQRLYAHPEATPHINRTLGYIRDAGMEAGVSINPGTPVEALEPLLEMVDAVLMMSVNPGFGGQAFLPITYRRLGQLRALMARLGVSPAVVVDGGVDGGNIAALAQAGMTEAVIGTALFTDGDPAATMRAIAGAAWGG